MEEIMEEIIFTDTLNSLIRKSLLLKKKYFIIRADKELPKDKFWLSANHNIKNDIFSIEDISSFWNVLEIWDDL
jgi:hypothetical protein